MTHEMRKFYNKLKARQQAIDTGNEVQLQFIEETLENNYKQLSDEEKELISLVCCAEVNELIF